MKRQHGTISEKGSSARCPFGRNREIRRVSWSDPAFVAVEPDRAHPANAGGAGMGDSSDLMVDEDGDRRLRPLLTGVLLLIVVSGTIDLVLDAPDSWRSFHVVYEVALIAGALATTVVLWSRWGRAERALSTTRRALDERQAERDAWRASAERSLQGLGAAMDDQLARWGLTPAERDVALLLLKGKSHKAIAYETGRSERTIRQHAVTVYQKSGLAGRAELAAYFLEDLALPGEREQRPTGASAP
jgi:DNA-binding CsgD family transcriptional regulator